MQVLISEKKNQQAPVGCEIVSYVPIETTQKCQKWQNEHTIIPEELICAFDSGALILILTEGWRCKHSNKTLQHCRQMTN
jgi:hypothetical protein